MEEKYGDVISNLPNIYKIGRKTVVFYVLFGFLRRLLQAVIILVLWNFPVLQILLTLILNLFYLIFIVTYKPFNSTKEFVVEFINEQVTVISIYLLCLYAGDYIQDPQTKDHVGLAMVTITVLNFLMNLLVVFHSMYHETRARCIKRAATKKFKQEQKQALKDAEQKKKADQ